MSVPYFSDKLAGHEITGPDSWASYMRGQGRFADFTPPDIFIFTWQKSFFNWVKSRYAHKNCSGFIGDVLLFDGRRSHEAGIADGKDRTYKVGLAGNFGIGAPSAVLMMESLISQGVRNFIGLGTAGGLMPGAQSLKVGDTILVDQAYRDEGTGYHYLASHKEARPDKASFRWLAELLEGANLPFKKGPVWTTDAFFRETSEEVDYYLEKGVLAVDMEASALFACANLRDVSMGSLFVISDILTREGWTPDFHHKDILKKLGGLFELLTGFDVPRT